MGIKNLAYSFFIFFGFLVFSENSYSADFEGCVDWCRVKTRGSSVNSFQSCIRESQQEGRCGPAKPAVKRPAAPKPQENKPAATAQAGNADKIKQCSDVGGQWNADYNFCECDTGSTNKILKEFAQGGFEKCNKTDSGSTQVSAADVCTKAGGYFGEDGYTEDVCVCNKLEGRTYSIAQLRANPSLTCGNSHSVQTTQTKQDASQFQCSDLNDFIGSVRKCEKDGGEAVAQCNKDQKGINENYDTATSIVGLMSQAALAKGAQAGSAESCYRTGTINAGAFYALNGLKETCEKEQDECRQICTVAKDERQRVVRDCSEKYKAQYGISGESTEQEQIKFVEYVDYLNKKVAEFNETLQSGVKKCEVDAKKNSNDLATKQQSRQRFVIVN